MIGDFRPDWDAQTGDIFDDGYGNIARIFRRSRSDAWCDIVVVQRDGAVWSKRMVRGIPAAWSKLPRR